MRGACLSTSLFNKCKIIHNKHFSFLLCLYLITRIHISCTPCIIKEAFKGVVSRARDNLNPTTCTCSPKIAYYKTEQKTD